MKQRHYIKFNNSQKTLDGLWSQLNVRQRNKLKKMLSHLDKDLIGFGAQEDIAYSILHHVIDGTVELKEVEKTVKELSAVHLKPYSNELDENFYGEIPWSK